eukprot:5777032-Prymnesium_polylepis.1
MVLVRATWHPNTHARQLTTDCHTRAQRRAQLALPHTSTSNEVLAALGAQQLQLHHLPRLLRLEHAGGRRRRHPRRYEQ